MKYDFEEINHLIRHRRSVFPHQFSESESVPKKVLEQALENATWAPTHGKTQPWRFFVFEGEKKAELGELQADLYKKKTASESFSEAKYEKLKNIALQSDYVIAISMQRQQTEKIPEIEEICAVACAVQNLHLTLCGYGYGGYWSTGGMTFVAEGKEMFGLGEKDKLMGFFYVGVPEGEIKDGVREDWQSKVTWVG